MNCNQCGNPVEANDKFCPTCGNQVDFSANTQPHETTEEIFSGETVNTQSHLPVEESIPVRIPQEAIQTPQAEAPTPVALVEPTPMETVEIPEAVTEEAPSVQPKEVQPLPAAEPCPEEPAEEKPKKKKRKGLWISLTVVFSLIVILALGVGHFGYSAFTVRNRFNDKSYKVAVDHYNAKVKGSSLRQGILEVLFWNRPESIAKNCQNGSLAYRDGIEQLKALVSMNVNHAQNQLDTLIPEYIDHVVKQGEENNKSEKYETTLLDIKTAKTIVPEGTNMEKLTALYDKTLPLYQEQVSKQVNQFVDKEQFDKAFETIAHALTVDDNEYFQTLKTETTKTYVIYITKTVTKQITKMQFDDAMNTITEAIKILPESQELLNLYEEVKAVIDTLQ